MRNLVEPFSVLPEIKTTRTSNEEKEKKKEGRAKEAEEEAEMERKKESRKPGGTLVFIHTVLVQPPVRGGLCSVPQCSQHGKTQMNGLKRGKTSLAGEGDCCLK